MYPPDMLYSRSVTGSPSAESNSDPVYSVLNGVTKPAILFSYTDEFMPLKTLNKKRRKKLEHIGSFAY